MTTKIFLAAFIVAAGLSIIAFFINLSSLFPAFLVYFTIALLSGCLTTFWLLRPASASASASGAGRKRRKKAPAKPAGKPLNGGKKEQGKVKWFSASKGFGFITRENGEDIFVHFRSIMGSGHRILQQGEDVEFSVTEGSKGLQAEDVSPLQDKA